MKEINKNDILSNHENSSKASFIQQQFWVLHSFSPDSSAYNIPLISVVEGHLNIAALENAFNDILNKYKIFRAVFEMDEAGELVQRFLPREKRQLTVVDLCPSQNGTTDATKVEKAINEEIRLPFNLATGPLLRFKLFRTGEHKYILSITVHHIIFDLATSELFAEELSVAYSAALKGHIANETVEIADYSEFCTYQNNWYKTIEREKMEEEWRLYLKDAESSLTLPFDPPAISESKADGKIVNIRLHHEMVKQIKTFCKNESTIPFLVRLTAWSLTLARLSGQRKLTIGVPLTNRRKNEFKNTMGCFVNILPMILDLSGDITIGEMLGKIRMTMLKMHRMQEIPYYNLVQMTRRNAGTAQGNPLYQTGFTFEHPMQLELEDLVVKSMYAHHGGAQLDLFGKFWDESDDIIGVIEYNCHKFDASSVEHIKKLFLETINEICTNQQRKIDITQIKEIIKSGNQSNYQLPDQEFLKLLEKWNKTDRDYPLDKCLQSFIEEQVAKTPDATALVFEDKALSYGELNNRANQLAHFLQSKGIGPESLVGVCTFRSMEMVIALLAVIKAGGAYVPFDPTYPPKRISYMINDSKVSIILAQKACASLVESDATQIIFFENIGDEIKGFPETNPPIKTSPDNLAYVIYTSGSTGNPKGVMNTHRGIVNRLLWMQETFKINNSDTLVQKTPFSFDVSVWEFFWAFMCGARLVVAKPEGHKDVDYLLNLIRKEKITIIHFVPSMLRLFLERANSELCSSLKSVVLSGEALTIDLQNLYFNILQIPLYNLYGPTEAAVDVSYWKCDPLSKSNLVPIGRPVSNTKLYILNEKLQHLPLGASGELHIGGVQVARGYLNRPELTAEKFIQDPFANDPSARLYKTGDLCRFLPDGNIEYLGRIDFQVKIRGNRIELGEIETAIRKDETVKDCSVLVYEETPGDQQLAAYIVKKSEQFSASALRSRLADELPDYMIPSYFIPIPSMPLSPSGKIDRLALPKPKRERHDLISKFVAPRGESEKLIVKIWQELLRLDAVGIDDNFFDLGGHSLLLVRLANRLKENFHKEISVMNLFEHPTIRKQVNLIRDSEESEADSKKEKQSASETDKEGSDWEDGII